MPRSTWLLTVLLLPLKVRPASAQTLSSEALVKSSRQGGYVIIVRHTSSPRDAPTQASANPDNVKLERQLETPSGVTTKKLERRTC
jgi:hypothetical protein